MLQNNEIMAQFRSWKAYFLSCRTFYHSATALARSKLKILPSYFKLAAVSISMASTLLHLEYSNAKSSNMLLYLRWDLASAQGKITHKHYLMFHHPSREWFLDETWINFPQSSTSKLETSKPEGFNYANRVTRCHNVCRIFKERKWKSAFCNVWLYLKFFITILPMYLPHNRHGKDFFYYLMPQPGFEATSVDLHQPGTFERTLNRLSFCDCGNNV